jgi:predicted Zn-dependent protease
VAQIAVPMSFLKFSRNAEREADLLGIEYEYAAGYDPGAMVSFFERLQDKDKKKPNFFVRAFATHPMNDDRLKRAQKTIEQLLPDKEQYLVTSSEFEQMKERLENLSGDHLGLLKPAQDSDKPVLKNKFWCGVPQDDVVLQQEVMQPVWWNAGGTTPVVPIGKR